MSEARKAIFARFKCPKAKATELHRQLTTQYDQLVKLYAETANLTFTDDIEANGNMILVTHFESVRASEERQAARYRAANRLAAPFQRTFKVRPLRYMPIGGLGFDIVKFDEEVVKSPDGESCKDAIRRQWGEAGLAIIVELMQSG